MKPRSKSVWIAPAACGARAFGHGPGARHLRARGEERDQMQERVAGADQPVEAGLAEADVDEEMLALLARQHGDLGLDLGGDHHRGLVFWINEHLAAIRNRGM